MLRLAFHRVLPAVFAGLVCVISANEAEAQAAQRFALQGAVLSTSIRTEGSDGIGGTGFEPQLRINQVLVTEKRGVISLGLGGQYTTHNDGSDNLKITGVFLEPRWVPKVKFERFFPYLSARLALLRQSSNFGTSSNGTAYGAGAGFAIVLTNTINIDAGVQLVRQQFGDFELTNFTPAPGQSAVSSFNPFTTYAAKIGLSFGFPSSN